MGAQERSIFRVRTVVMVGVLVWLAASFTGFVQPATAESSAESSSRIVEHVELTMDDGVVLRGHVVRPAGSAEQVPVVLWSTPYGGSLDPDIHDSAAPPGARGTVVPVDLLVEHGYAVVQFHVRGTSHSGGCFNLFGPRDQADQAALVRWAADQFWSTGRVGMIGQSGDAIPALSAAVAAPKPLKTIVVEGIVSDVYTAAFSPQGAVMDDQFWSGLGAFYGGVAAMPPRPSVTDPAADPYAEYATELAAPRFCPEAIEVLNATTRATFDLNRDGYRQFFEDRRWLPKLGNVQAATLLWHGQQDHLAFEDDRVWEALTSAPKWQWLGQWEHEPVDPMYNHREDILLPWLDYWLKNQGSRPSAVGGVDYEVSHGGPHNTAGEYDTDPENGDTDGRDWRRSRSWPPAEAVQNTLRFTEQGLRSGIDREGSRTFWAMPDTAERHPTADPRDYSDPADGTQPLGYAPPCPGTTDGHTALVYESKPLKDDTVIAGNPIAHLQLRSDLPAGSFSVQLFALSPDFECTDGQPFGYRYLTEGGVDLRFVGDGTGDPWYRDERRYQATPFPTDEQVAVRVDLQSLAEHLPAEHRLAAVFTLGAQKARIAQGHFPKLTVHGSSRLQLPVVQGGFNY